MRDRLGIAAAMCAFACTPLACGGLLAIEETAPPADAGVDAAPPPRPRPPVPPDAAPPPPVPKCTKQRPADPPGTLGSTPSAFFAKHPLPQIANQGGSVLAN